MPSNTDAARPELDEAEARAFADPGGQERSISWLLSAVLHLSMMLAFGLFWQVTPRGASIASDR